MTEELKTDVVAKFAARYGGKPFSTDLDWWREDKVAEASEALRHLDGARSEKRSRTEIASLKSDFDLALEEIRDIDKIINSYLARRDARWRSMLRRAYGYVPA